MSSTQINIKKRNGKLEKLNINKENLSLLERQVETDQNRLENGWSKQAPKGMVALTLAEMRTKYRNVLI